MTQTTPLTDRQRRSRYYAQNGRPHLTPKQRRRHDKKIGQADHRERLAREQEASRDAR